METLTFLPLIKVGVVFVLVVGLLRLSLQVGAALGTGAAVLGLLFTMSPWEILRVSVASLTETKTLLLALIVTLILILSTSMEELGQMDHLLHGFRRSLGGRRWGIVAFPALIGLLPMPGGAVFSAPMLDAFDKEKHLSPSLKSFLNYWYRHIWEYWWPLYPAVLMTCTIADINLWRFALLSCPLTLVAVLAGLPALLQVPRSISEEETHNAAYEDGPIWRSFIPILMAILPGVGFGILIQFATPRGPLASVPREAGLIAGLLAGVAWAWWDKGIGAGRALRILLDPKLRRMWLTVAGVFIFKGMMEHSGAARAVGEVLLRLDIPLFWVAVLLPMIVGGISGLGIAYVGATFPILVTLVYTMEATSMKLPLMVLGFASGFVGILMTPLHLCLILSNEYFKAPWGGVYRHLALSGILLMAGAIIYFWVLRGICG